jgi:hypothetical protein
MQQSLDMEGTSRKGWPEDSNKGMGKRALGGRKDIACFTSTPNIRGFAHAEHCHFIQRTRTGVYGVGGQVLQVVESAMVVGESGRSDTTHKKGPSSILAWLYERATDVHWKKRLCETFCFVFGFKPDLRCSAEPS